MINYYCPGFVEAQPVYRTLFKLRALNPECFFENVSIKKIYGNFPNMIWNGGSVWNGPSFSRQKVISYFEWYATQNVSLQLICTNPVLEETDVYDRYCNMILDIASNYRFVEVLVSSPILDKYIQSKYPMIKVDKSIVGTTSYVNTEHDTIENYLTMLSKYNMIVLPKKYSKDLNSLDKIPQHLRERIEILVTDPCPDGCPSIYQHYEDYGKVQLGILSPDYCSYCIGVKNDTPFRHWTNRKCQYDYEEVRNVLEPRGFTEIKISGRTNATHTILSIVPYLIKPEFHKDVYTLMFSDYSADIMDPIFY